MFSKSCEYSLRAIIFIAQQTIQNNKVGLTTISEETNSPQAFTAKILQKLTRSGVLKSIKGPYGGFIVEEARLDTKLSEVVNIIDGDSIYERCGLGLKQCDDNNPCPLHFKFVQIREELKQMIENTSLKSLVTDTNLESIILKG